MKYKVPNSLTYNSEIPVFCIQQERNQTESETYTDFAIIIWTIRLQNSTILFKGTSHADPSIYVKPVVYHNKGISLMCAMSSFLLEQDIQAYRWYVNCYVCNASQILQFYINLVSV